MLNLEQKLDDKVFSVFTGTSDNKTAALFPQKDEFRRWVVKSHNGIVG